MTYAVTARLRADEYQLFLWDNWCLANFALQVFWVVQLKCCLLQVTMYFTIVNLNVFDATYSQVLDTRLPILDTATIWDNFDVLWNETIDAITPDPPQLMNVVSKESYSEGQTREVCRP